MLQELEILPVPIWLKNNKKVFNIYKDTIIK